MNDRYLYRAKRIDNGVWIVGSLIQAPYLGSIRSWISSEQEDKARLREISSNQAVWRAFEVKTDTICQRAGLPDKHKKPICENDIVKDEDGSVGVIKFGKYDIFHIGFYIEWITENATGYRNELGYWAPKVEVIGSAIDNPELLEVGE